MASIEGRSGIQQNYGIEGEIKVKGGKGPDDKGNVGSGISGGTGNIPLNTGFEKQMGEVLTRGFNQPKDLSSSETRLEKGAEKLTSEEVSKMLEKLLSAVRDPDVLSKLMIEFSAMSRQNALDSRLAARSQARSELETQASETREAAVKQLAAAIVSFVFSVAAAMIAIGGAAKAGGELKSAGSSLKEAAQTQRVIDAAPNMSMGDKARLDFSVGASKAQADLSLRAGDLTNQVTQALSGLANAMKGLIEGSLTSSAKMDEATGQEMAAAAQDSQANADMAKKFMDELEEMIRSAMQFIKDIQNAQTELMATASRL